MRDAPHHHYSVAAPALPWQPAPTVCKGCAGTESHGTWHGAPGGGWLCDHCYQKPPAPTSGVTWERRTEMDLARKGLVLGPRQKEGHARGVFRPTKRR